VCVCVDRHTCRELEYGPRCEHMHGWGGECLNRAQYTHTHNQRERGKDKTETRPSRDIWL